MVFMFLFTMQFWTMCLSVVLLFVNLNGKYAHAVFYKTGGGGESSPGARFSKLPVITGPVKLFWFPFQVGV